MFNQMRSALFLFIILTVVTGVFYPLAVTGVGQLLWPYQSNASLIKNKEGKILGSELIGQNFNDPKYFWSRLSGTTPAYNASASSGSNLGPSNKTLVDHAEARIKLLREGDPGNTSTIPADLVTSSGSGLDPHISITAAKYQIERIARSRNLPTNEISRLVDQFIERRSFNLLGQPRVNVLKLNLALDQYHTGDILNTKKEQGPERGLTTKVSIY